MGLGGMSNLPPCFCCGGVFLCTVGRVCFCSYFTGVLRECSLSPCGERPLNFHCNLAWDSVHYQNSLLPSVLVCMVMKLFLHRHDDQVLLA